MADSLDLFTGVLLTAIGLVLIYGSIIYRLIDLILIIGVLVTIFGLYKLLPAFLLRLLESRGSMNSRNNALSTKNSSNSSLLKAGAEEISNFLNGDEKDVKSKPLLQGREQSSLDSPNQMTFDEYMSKSKTSFAKDYTPKEVKPIFKDNSVDESKQVLRTKPVEEEKPKFKLPSIRKSSSKPAKKRSYAFLKKDNEEKAPDKVYFTPNYERPVKISRKPKKKENKVNLSEAPKRSREISEALASVGTTETIYDNSSSDESYSLMPKEIDEELIMPINEIDFDDSYDEPVYNLPQSENTAYNNVLYDELDGDDSDYFITPIHVEATDEDRQYSDIYFDSLEELEAPYADEAFSEVDDGYITVDAYDDALPRPTSIAYPSPISKKEVGSNLSRPHKKSVQLPRPTAVSNLARPHKKEVSKDPVLEDKPALVDEQSSSVNEDAGSNEQITLEDTISKDAEEVVPKEELDEILADSKDETIQIDPNNPESLPIPKLLNSYVICEKGILTSQEAFEEVASHSQEEILLEAPTVKDMGERFLSSIADIKTRIIVQEFDLEDISYVLLLSSLIKKGVEIKTLPMVNSFNLIGDSSHALLISNSVDQEDFEYGAVYTDLPSIENIKEMFESSWKIAKDLDISGLNN